MTADQHPALITEDSGLPSLTLVLPGDAGQVLTDLALAVSKTRQTMVEWAEAFRRRRDECAASGDQLGQAMARGQVVTGEHVIDHLDENIVEVFGLWDQYEAQVPPPGAGQPGVHPLPAGGADGQGYRAKLAAAGVRAGASPETGPMSRLRQ